MRDKDTLIIRCLSVGICIFVLMILVIFTDSPEESDEYRYNDPVTDSVIFADSSEESDGYSYNDPVTDSVIFADSPEESDGYSYYDFVTDQDGRIIRVKETQNGVEGYTYQGPNETDDELAKTFYKVRTDDGAAVRIVSFCDGEEKVLMDCEYSTVDFPYYFERGYDDIFYTFYLDDFIWEKTIYVESIGKTYTLYYAQEIQYDSEDEEVTGCEGHLWVTDEDTRIVKRLFWQSEEPCTKITWEESMLLLQYADGSDRTCTLSEILEDPAEAVYEKCMQIDYSVIEYSIDTEKYDDMTDQIYKEAYYRAISGQDMVRTSQKEEEYLWELNIETFQEIELDYTQFYYMDFDGDGLPELVVDIMGGGLYILKYLPNEEIVEMILGYERAPSFHLLGSGQLYYHHPTLANIDMWKYVTVDADGQDYLVVYFEENADYKPHKDDEDEWWDMAYFVRLDEELGLVQVDEKRYQEITAKFFDAVEQAVTEMKFEEVFPSHDIL